MKSVSDMKNQSVGSSAISGHADEIIQMRAQLDKKSNYRLTKKMAVLFTDVQGSSAYFKTHGDAAGRIMLQRHNNMLFPLVEEEGGGVIVKTIGDSIMASFQNPTMALRSAVEMQRKLFNYNRNRSRRNQIHIRIGIHFGDIIVEDDDIFGDVVNMTSRILSLAKADHIFVSQSIYNIMKETEVGSFRSVNIRMGPGELERLKVYEVLWREDIPAIRTISVMSLKVVTPRGGEEKGGDWLNHWAEKCFDLVIPIIHRKTKRLVAKSGVELLAVFKSPVTPVGVARELMEIVPKHNAERANGEPVEFEIFIDTGGVEIDSGVEEDNIEEMAGERDSLSAVLQPNEIYITKNVHGFLKDGDKAQCEPAAVSADGTVLLYQMRWIKREQNEVIKLFHHRKRLADGNDPKCFYCGSKKHPANRCPSKTVWDSPDSLAELGHLSFGDINSQFGKNVESTVSPHESSRQNETGGKSEDAGLAFKAFYELSRPFQLHFLKRIWLTKARRWSGIEKTPKAVKQEGGPLWLGLDSIRVSKLEQAETLLKAEAKRYPNDYRIFTALGFLYVEKRDLSQALDHFEEAMVCADSILQKGYIAFLAFRVYEVANRLNEAHQKIEEVLAMIPDCLEARYRKALFMIRVGEYQRGIQDLRSIIEKEPAFYVNVLIDPDLTAVEDQIDIFLLGLFEEARDKAMESLPKTEREVKELRKWLGSTSEKHKSNMELLGKISSHLESDSYMGFTDASALQENILYACKMILSNLRSRAKEKVSVLVSRLTRDMKYVTGHPCIHKLGNLSFSLKDISNEVTTAKSNTIFIENSKQFRDANSIIQHLSEYAREMAPVIKRLRRLEKIQLVVNAAKKVSLFVLGGFAVGGALFPLATYYVAYFSSNSHLVTEMLWKHQAAAIFVGTMGGLIAGVVAVLSKDKKKNYFST